MIDADLLPDAPGLETLSATAERCGSSVIVNRVVTLPIHRIEVRSFMAIDGLSPELREPRAHADGDRD